MASKRIVIIGGVASGTKTAAKARREDPQAEITLITKDAEISYASCGMPYFISDIIKERNDLLVRGPDYFRNILHVSILMEHCVDSIDPNRKNVTVRNLKNNQSLNVPYDRLVLAVGASPKIPNIEGVQYENIFTLHSIPSAVRIKSIIQQKKIKNAVLVGGGFIALEMAESFMMYGIKASLIIRSDQILSQFDKDIALLVQNHIKIKGVQIFEEDEVEKFVADKDGKVTDVITKKQSLSAEIVLLATGLKPNVRLAANAGVTIGTTGAIRVNERLETDVPDIYAVGDCVETTHLVTGKPVWIPLATTANKHGRIAGINICDGHDTFPGTMGTFVVKVFDWTVGKTGLSENEARKKGFDTESIIVPAYDKAHYYPGSKQIIVKLIAEKRSGRILGAEIAGDGVVDKRVDVVASALSGKATIEQLSKYDLSYAPPYSIPMDPVITAANVLRSKLEGKTQSISPLQVKEKKEGKERFIVLDVRSKSEYASGHIKDAVHIPLNDLSANMNRLDTSQEIVTCCGIGARAAQAHRILKNAGFKDTKFMEGGMSVWGYGSLSYC